LLSVVDPDETKKSSLPSMSPKRLPSQFHLFALGLGQFYIIVLGEDKGRWHKSLRRKCTKRRAGRTK